MSEDFVQSESQRKPIANSHDGNKEKVKQFYKIDASQKIEVLYKFGGDSGKNQ